ncbi:hypothetical protein NRIC_02520 [Enterococcus florum]|uniref:DUF1189 domain-containing protein n=1 Tax=Enterococcus florum TaxID=2480627 RepID=A0A4P5P821_9ENTE|nr:DUF1189 domain-containing protein [Enterococcus florum]GCF92361.1 hypothetical protein NRIC_02520 [Enterococcus florum]
MTFRQLIQGAMFRFSTLKHAKDAPFWKAIIYLILLSIVFSLPTVYQTMEVMNEIRNDSQKIAERIPDFQIVNGEIETSRQSEGFIYQTNSIIWTFDPEGKRSEHDIANDLIGNFFSVGLLKSKAVLALPDFGGVSTSMFGDNVLEFPYDSEPLKGLTGSTLREELEDLQLPFWAPIIMLLAALYPTMINLVVTFFFAAIIGHIFARLRLRQITFFESFKTMIFCGTIPVLISTLIMFFSTSFDFSLLITLASVFIYSQVANSFPQMKLPGQ